MISLGIYIMITGLVAISYFYLFAPILLSQQKQRTLHKMIYYDQVNDLVNSISTLKKQSIDSWKLEQLLRKSLLGMTIPLSLPRAAVFILYLEQYLMEDALTRKSSYFFHAARDMYSTKINPSTAYQIVQWTHTLLATEADHINLELTVNKYSNIQLIVKKITLNNGDLALNTYLSNLAYHELPGKLRISPKGYLIIEL